MSDLPGIDLAHLATRDLQVLLQNARGSGRVGLERAVARELLRRSTIGRATAQGIKVSATSLQPAGRRRGALPWAAGALVTVITAGGLFLARDWEPQLSARLSSEPATSTNATAPSGPAPYSGASPRAHVALAPDLARAGDHRASGSRPVARVATDRPKAVQAHPPSALPRGVVTPRPDTRLADAAEVQAPMKRSGAQDAGGTILALSRSSNAAALECRGLVDPAERMVCEDGKHRGAGQRVARLAGVPVRVSIIGSTSVNGASRLNAPGMGGNPGAPGAPRLR